MSSEGTERGNRVPSVPAVLRPSRAAHKNPVRPLGIALLSGFFAAAGFIAVLASATLLVPGTFADVAWRLNPRAQTEFGAMGQSAVLLLQIVGIACVLSTVGLWKGTRWGYRIALFVLSLSLLGDFAKVIHSRDLRAAICLPIVGGTILYMASARVRRFCLG